MISTITFINLFMLAFARRPTSRSWGSPAWHMEPQSNPWSNQVVMPEPGSGITGHPMQWQESQSMNQWQEEAASSIKYPFPNLNSYSHYAQAIPQNHMIYGQPGFSPYATPFHSVRSDNLTQTPKYTSTLKHLEEAAEALLKHVSADSDGKLSEAQVQYVMILTALNDLMDDVINMGTESYSSRYNTVIHDAIAKVEKNPLPSALSIKTRINTVQKQLAAIIDLIKQKQAGCAEPISTECDAVIDEALAKSKDLALQTEASFFVALGESMELFSRIYLYQVAQISNNNGADNYLLYSSDHLKPLVLAGAEARKLGHQVNLLPLLRSNRHFNQLNHALQNRRHNNNN